MIRDNIREYNVQFEHLIFEEDHPNDLSCLWMIRISTYKSSSDQEKEREREKKDLNDIGHSIIAISTCISYMNKLSFCYFEQGSFVRFFDEERTY